MPELRIDDMQDGYAELVNYVMRYGDKRSPRGFPTRDVQDLTVVLRNPERALTEYIGRKASTKLAALEALEVVAGRSWPDLKTRVAPNTKQFLNPDTDDFHGAYGPRIAVGIHDVIRRLGQDPDTRQAVINIFDASRDLADGVKDVPCNVMVMYSIKDGRLHAKTITRSNDVWWGVAHDVFTFTILQRTLAAFLGLEVGNYSWTAYSMHVYERDFDAVSQLHSPSRPATESPPIIATGDHSWDDVKELAIRIAYGEIVPNHLSWWMAQAATWQT